MSNPRSALAASLQEILAPLGVIVGGLQPLDVPLPWAPEVLGAFIEVGNEDAKSGDDTEMGLGHTTAR